MDPKGKTALVTGGARRVGRAVVESLAAAGAGLVIHFHESRAEAEALSSSLRAAGTRCFLVNADLGDAGSVKRMLEHLSAECPPVDILVNSASVFPRTPLADVTVEQWDEVHAVNLRAPFLLGRELGMAMAQRGWGKIINISDCAVNRPYKNYLPYLVSKAGLVSLTRVLALELAPHVQVNTIAPGTVLMPEGADGGLESLILAKTPLKRIGTPEDVAKLVRFLVEDGDFATGGFFAMDGGAGIPA